MGDVGWLVVTPYAFYCHSGSFSQPEGKPYQKILLTWIDVAPWEWKAMGTYRQTNDSNRYGKDNAEPFSHRLSPYLLFWVAVLTLGVWSMFYERNFCCHIPIKTKTTRTFEHRWEAWRVLVPHTIRTIIDNTSFLAGKSTIKWISLTYLYLTMLNQTLKSYFSCKTKWFPR